MSAGLSLYAYTAFRLLAPLHVLAALAVYRSSRYRKEQLCLILGSVVLALPFAVYAAGHFENLASRFNYVTYLRDPQMGLYQKLTTFVGHYLDYFGVSFLAISGDSNRRHHTGLGGEFLLSTVILLGISLHKIFRQGMGRFQIYLLAGILLAPIAAATTSDVSHSLRTFSMSLFVVMLSAYGLRNRFSAITRSMLALTAVCAVVYIVHYFVSYPAESVAVFETYGFKHALQDALAQNPKRVILLNDRHQPYIKLRFFGSLIGTQVPLLTGAVQDVRDGDAIVFYNPSPGVRGFYTASTSLGSIPLGE